MPRPPKPIPPSPAAIATWKQEAEQLIVVVPAQGVGGTGSPRVCIVGEDGAHYEVARFSPFAALVTGQVALRDADEYADLLRQRYVNLARGDSTGTFGKRVPV
jgi:hypothetical protein